MSLEAVVNTCRLTYRPWGKEDALSPSSLLDVRLTDTADARPDFWACLPIAVLRLLFYGAGTESGDCGFVGLWVFGWEVPNERTRSYRPSQITDPDDKASKRVARSLASLWLPRACRADTE